MPAFAKPLLQQPLSRTFRGERENRVIVDMILGPLKPSARWCFVAAKLDFGSCLLGSIPHTSQIKLPETWGFPGGRMDLGHCIFRGSFADLSRIFREIRLPKVASADSYSKLSSGYSLQRTLQPELRHPTPTAETQGFHYTSCVNFPSIPTGPFPLNKTNNLKYLKLLFRDLSRSKLLPRSFATQHFSFAKVM